MHTILILCLVAVGSAGGTDKGKGKGAEEGAPVRMETPDGRTHVLRGVPRPLPELVTVAKHLMVEMLHSLRVRQDEVRQEELDEAEAKRARTEPTVTVQGDAAAGGVQIEVCNPASSSSANPGSAIMHIGLHPPGAAGPPCNATVEQFVFGSSIEAKDNAHVSEPEPEEDNSCL